MIDIDPEHLSTLPSAANLAYLDGDSHEFLGEPLKSFSARRQIAAQAIGNRLLSGRVTREQDGMYDGMLADVVGVLFLCRCPESDVCLAVRRPEKIIEKAMAWADDSAITIGSQAFEQACEIYGRIFEALEASQFRVKQQAASKNE